MPEPTVWTLKGFCDHFKFVHEKMHDHSIAWVLGAGASRASGIPTGGQLVDAWLREMHVRLDREKRPFEVWATEENLGIKGFNLSTAPSFYPRVYERRFRDHPDEGYAYLEELMAGKEPSPGYSILAKTIESTRHRVVITTNFDNLIADALSIYTDTFPFVVGHESLTGFVRASMRRPLVCKIHRDLLMGPKNDPRSLKRLHESWAGTLRSLLSQHTPVFVGYGGNDDSLMDLLESLEPGDIKGQLIWCFYEKDQPSERIKDLVVQHHGVLVPIPDFDLFMVLLGSVLGIEPLDQVIEQRALKRTTNYRERVLAIDTTGHPEIAVALSSTLERAGGWWAWELRARRERDLDKRESIYHQGLHKFPRSAQLHSVFASFMANVKGNPDEAEGIYKKILEIEPDSAASYVFMAAHYWSFKPMEIAQIESFFKRAIECEPGNVSVSTNYANFMWKKVGRLDEAEYLIRKALAVEPSNVQVVMSLAEFLARARKDADSAIAVFRKYSRENDVSLSVYGGFAAILSDSNKYPDEAEAYFKALLDAEPNNNCNALNYAEFLLIQDRPHEARHVLEPLLSKYDMSKRLQAVLFLMFALMERLTGHDNAKSLGRLKTVLRSKLASQGWVFENLKSKLGDWKLTQEEFEFYSTLMNLTFVTPDLSALDRFAPWRQLV